MKIPFKLIASASYFARKYGKQVLHLNDENECAKFLGEALRDQRDLIEDKNSGTFMTLYDSLERLLEIKVLMTWTAKKMGIETKGKPPVALLSEIATYCDTECGTYNKDIKDTLSWAQDFFARPDVAEVFEEADIYVALPENPLHFPKTILALGMRIKQEGTRLHRVLKVAKAEQDKKQDSDNDNTPPKDEPVKKPNAKKPPRF